MRWQLLCAAAVIVSGCQKDATRESSKEVVLSAEMPPFPITHTTYSYDDAWRRTIQALAIEGISITEENKAAGFVRGKGSFAQRPELFSCGKGKGIPDAAQEFTVTVIANAEGGGTALQIQTDAKMAWYQHHRIIFVKYGHVVNYASCTSNNVIEKRVADRITAF